MRWTLALTAIVAPNQVVVPQPVKGTFNGYEIISMPPPSSGGIALIEMLNMLEAGGLTSESRQSVKAIHLIVEAQRRAYLDRARYLGDTDFVEYGERLYTEFNRQLRTRPQASSTNVPVSVGQALVAAVSEALPERLPAAS